MITRIRGVLLEAHPSYVVVDVQGVGYEAQIPASSAAHLHALRGEIVELWTIYELEGNVALGSLTPKLIGFLTPIDRAFFQAFTRVKGVSTRRALRAMELPTATLAAAIERGDAATLTGLPEVGKKTAAAVIAELRDVLPDILRAARAAAGALDSSGPELEPAAGGADHALLEQEAARTAIDVLVAWGDRRTDAERWVTAVLRESSESLSADALVRAAYRRKATGA